MKPEAEVEDLNNQESQETTIEEEDIEEPVESMLSIFGLKKHLEIEFLGWEKNSPGFSLLQKWSDNDFFPFLIAIKVGK